MLQDFLHFFFITRFCRNFFIWFLQPIGMTSLNLLLQFSCRRPASFAQGYCFRQARLRPRDPINTSFTHPMKTIYLVYVFKCTYIYIIYNIPISKCTIRTYHTDLLYNSRKRLVHLCTLRLHSMEAGRHIFFFAVSCNFYTGQEDPIFPTFRPLHIRYKIVCIWQCIIL